MNRIAFQIVGAVMVVVGRMNETVSWNSLHGGARRVLASRERRAKMCTLRSRSFTQVNLEYGFNNLTLFTSSATLNINLGRIFYG